MANGTEIITTEMSGSIIFSGIEEKSFIGIKLPPTIEFHNQALSLNQNGTSNIASLEGSGRTKNCLMIGQGLQGCINGQIVLGEYNENNGVQYGDDKIFVIGNGHLVGNEETRKDSFFITRNGDIWCEDIYFKVNSGTPTNLKELLNKITWAAGDSGWIDINDYPTDNILEANKTYFSYKFTNYHSNYNHLQFRKINNVVFLQGEITPTGALAGYDDDSSNNYNDGYGNGYAEHTICTLPQAYAPSKNFFQLCQGSGTSIWLLEIYTNGKVTFTRYRNDSTYNTDNWPKNKIWMPISCSFCVN